MNFGAFCQGEAQITVYGLHFLFAYISLTDLNNGHSRRLSNCFISMYDYLAAAIRTQHVNPDTVNLFVNDTSGFHSQFFQFIGC